MIFVFSSLRMSASDCLNHPWLNLPSPNPINPITLLTPLNPDLKIPLTPLNRSPSPRRSRSSTPCLNIPYSHSPRGSTPKGSPLGGMKGAYRRTPSCTDCRVSPETDEMAKRIKFSEGLVDEGVVY